MKTTIQLLSLLLCLEFIIGPVRGTLLLPQTSYAQAKTCPTGQTYNSSVNRCLTSEEVIRVNNATQICGTDRDCYKKNAKAELDKAVSSNAVGDHDSFFKNAGGEQKGIVKAGNAVVLAIPVLIATNVLVNKYFRLKKEQRPGYKCNPPSLLLMYGGAAALAAGEIIGYFGHKSKLKKIREEWDKSVVPNAASSTDKKRTEATEAQSQAFEFLAQNEDQVAKTAKLKKGFYLAATGLFAAGALAGALEQVQLNMARATLTTATDPATRIAAEDKIRRLTCSTQGDTKTQKTTEELKTKNDEVKTAEADLEKAKNATYANDTDRENAILEKQNNLNLKQEELKNFKDSNKIDADGKFKVDKPIKKKSTFINICLPGDPNCQAPIRNKGEKEKLLKVAVHNISTARNAEQLVQLLKEYDSIEFENYSQKDYLGDDAYNDLKNHTISTDIAQLIASSIYNDAHAQEPPKEKTDDKKSAVGSFLSGIGGSVVSGVKKISGIIKFKNGVPMESGELDKIKDAVDDKVSKAIGMPVTRIAINGVLGGWMGVMTHHMGKQAEICEDRAKKLRSMKEEFNSANGLLFCKEEDREDPSKPKCYCFTADNKKNPGRSKSKICDDHFVAMESNIKSLGASGTKVCMDQSLGMDPSCSCRNKKGADGRNTCLKATGGFDMSGFTPGTFKMISAGGAPANDLFNGNASGGQISDTSGTNAARIRSAADQILQKTNPADAANSKKFADDLQKSLLATTGGLSMSGQSGMSALPTSPAAAAAALDEELKEKDQEVGSVGQAGAVSAGGSPTEEQPEFGMTEEQMAAQETEVAEVMGKEIDMGNNDINSGSNTNIFDVLSNRYQRSGMRRLFDEKGETKADAPDKSDIAP